MKENWKIIGLVVLLTTAGVFVAIRWRSGFQPSSRPPLTLQDLESPSFTWNANLRASWARMQELLKAARAEAATERRSLESVRLVSVGAGAKESLLWDTVAFINPGFTPLTRFEVQDGLRTNRFIGFYTWEGQPLKYTLKSDPHQPNAVMMTLHLQAPIEPGQTSLVFRVERRTDLVQTTKGGNLTVNLGRLRPVPDRLEARGVVLPAGARLLDHKPEEGAAIIRGDGQMMINWLSTYIRDNGTGLNVQFSLGGS
jgi:hypothetical protein